MHAVGLAALGLLVLAPLARAAAITPAPPVSPNASDADSAYLVALVVFVVVVVVVNAGLIAAALRFRRRRSDPSAGRPRRAGSQVRMGMALGVPLALLAALLFPAVLLGNWLGNKASGRIGDRSWRICVGMVLGGAAAAALWKAFV